MTPSLATLRPWALPAVVVLLVFVTVRQCNARHSAEATLQSERERADLERRGQEVVAPVPDIRPRVHSLELENADLRAALALTRAAAPTAKPIAVVRASTGRVRVAAHPATQAPSSGATSSPVQPPAGHSGEGGASPRPCVLREGDDAEIRIDEVALRTKAGTTLLVGAASAWRGDVRLFGGPFSAAATEAAQKAPPAPDVARWGVGVVAGAGTHGLLAGGLVTSPEGRLPLLGWRIAAVGIGAAGASEAIGLLGVQVRP